MTGEFDSNTVLAIARRYRAMPTNGTLDELAAAILAEDANPSFGVRGQSDSSGGVIGDGRNDARIAEIQSQLRTTKDAKTRSALCQQLRELRGRGELFNDADRRNRP
jgi:hypothetical protein